MRRHFLFAEDEREKSVGDGRVNLLRLWLNRRCAMLEGDATVDGGEANAQVAQELTVMWDLAKPMSSTTLSRDEYVAFFARVAKSLVLPLSSDAPAIAVAQRDWEYDLEGTGGLIESTKGSSNSDKVMMSVEQFREALIQIAELVLPVDSGVHVFHTFLVSLRNSIAEIEATSEPEQDETNTTEPVERFTLKPLNRISKIGNDAFLQKSPPSSDALRAIRGLPPPDSREMSLKQLLLSYNPRKFSLTRAFPQKKPTNGTTDVKVNSEEVKKEVDDVEDVAVMAQKLHLQLLGAVGVGATPTREKKLLRESSAYWDPEQATITSLTDRPALCAAVVGPPGSGKSRLARVLAQRLKLRYLSLDEAVQHAVDRKLRLRRARVEATPVVETEDTTVETATPTEATEEGQATATYHSDNDEEMDRAFQDDHLDAMLSGGVVSRDVAVQLLRLEATRSLLGGVGVMIDDVYPAELASADQEHPVGIDYLVALTALPNELEFQLESAMLAPTTGRLYSARELAILQAINSEKLAAKGFADCLLPERKSGAEVEEMKEITTENNEVEPDTEGQGDGETSPGEGEGVNEESVPAEEPLPPPPEPTPAEQNEIEQPKEPILPFGVLSKIKLVKSYREYMVRMQRELLLQKDPAETEDYHFVVVLAAQSLNVIRDHCIQAITGTTLGISRFSVSREASPISLPDDLIDANRAEQVKWLLYGDWSSLLEPEASSTIPTFARLPRRNGKWRLLSKWREFCPVSSIPESGLVLGSPEFAACYSGRVYLLASREARRSFCAHPLQHLRRELPVPSKCCNYWLIATGGDGILTPSYLQALETELHSQAISAAKLLKTSGGISMEMRLMSGQVVSSVEAAVVATEALKVHLTKNSSSKWMLTDLPFTRDVAAVLLEHSCVPEVIVLLDSELGATQDRAEETNPVNASALSALRRQQFQAEKAAVGEVTEVLGGSLRVITCPLFSDPADTLAAIEGELDPTAPRLDSIYNGHAPQQVDENDPAIIFAPPVPDKDDLDNKQVSPPQNEEEGSDPPDPEALAAAEAARSRALQLHGETGRFCPVSWKLRGVLVPGLPSNVCLYRQRFYAFAGDKEQRAFERNPAAFLPSGPRATASFVPSILLLGVRGSGRGRIATALALNQTSVEFKLVDLASVVSTAERWQQLQELLPEDTRTTPEEIFVTALKDEMKLQRPASDKALAQVIVGLGPEPSRIPTTSTLEQCFKHNFFPTLVVPLAVSEEDAVATLLSRWAAKLPAPRRNLPLTRKKEIDGEAGKEETATDGEDEEPPFDFELAREDESTRLHEQFAEDQKMLDEALAALRARGVMVGNSVNASGPSRQSAKRVKSVLNHFMTTRESLFERCEVVDMAMVDQLLLTGELLVGKHGFACPVSGRTDSLTASSAVAYRDQLYFPRSQEAQRAFMACPARYLEKTSLPPRHQPTCCVAGPPLSGKTRVAQELANALGLVHVSPQSAVDWVVQCHGGSMLRRHLVEMVEQQQNPLQDADLTHKVICARLRSSECQTRGWVLDGYLLNNQELLLSLDTTKASYIRPDMLFILEGGFSHVWQEHQTHADRNELRMAFARWQQHRLKLLTTWTQVFGSFHVRQLDCSKHSLWHLAGQAQEYLTEQQQLASSYVSAQASGRAARSLGVVRSSQELQARQHRIFQTFCPVELRTGRFYSSRLTSREHCVDFRGSSFWFGNQQNADQFIETPEVFIGGEASTPRRQELWPSQEEAESDAQTLVERAPVNASVLSLLTVADCDFPELKGYCPVTFASGSGAKNWASLRHGSVFFRASYRSKAFLFVSDAARRKFCYEPSRYASQSLPVKLPPQVKLAKSYPGQLEQQLGAALNEVLLALGSERPKFLQISTRASACVYLALSLKALHRRYQLKLQPTTEKDRDEDELDEEQKQRQQRREEEAERDAIARRDAFVRDCRLGEQLKAASTPANTSAGSGAKVARTMRAAQDSLTDLHQNGREDYSAVLLGDDIELLRHRFDVIVSGSGGGDNTLPLDTQAARKHAQAAFLEYTKASS